MKRLLKKLGRIFVILTNEDTEISSDFQRNLLIIGSGEDEHLKSAINSVRCW